MHQKPKSVNSRCSSNGLVDGNSNCAAHLGGFNGVNSSVNNAEEKSVLNSSRANRTKRKVPKTASQEQRGSQPKRPRASDESRPMELTGRSSGPNEVTTSSSKGVVAAQRTPDPDDGNNRSRLPTPVGIATIKYNKPRLSEPFLDAQRANYIVVVLVHYDDWHLCDELKENLKFQFHVFGGPPGNSLNTAASNISWHPKPWTIRHYFLSHLQTIKSGSYDVAVIACDEVFKRMEVEKYMHYKVSEMARALGFMKVLHIQTRRDLDNLKNLVPTRVEMINRALHFDSKVLQKLTKQIEFYFSDQNYPFDDHLQNLVKQTESRNGPGYLHFREINKWRHIQFLTQKSRTDGSFRRGKVDMKAVLEAAVINSNEDVELSHDLKGVYRQNTENVKRLRKERNGKVVFLRGLRGPWKRFNNPKLIEGIKTQMRYHFGDVGRVQICWKRKNKGRQRVSGYFRVEFGTEEAAGKCKELVKQGFVLWENPLSLVTEDEYNHHPKFIVSHNWVKLGMGTAQSQSARGQPAAPPDGRKSNVTQPGPYECKRSDTPSDESDGSRKSHEKAGTRDRSGLVKMYEKLPEEKPDKRLVPKVIPRKPDYSDRHTKVNPKGRPSARSFMV